MKAARGGRTDCVRELLSSGAVVDLADKVSYLILMYLYRQHAGIIIHLRIFCIYIQLCMDMAVISTYNYVWTRIP